MTWKDGYWEWGIGDTRSGSKHKIEAFSLLRSGVSCGAIWREKGMEGEHTPETELVADIKSSSRVHMDVEDLVSLTYWEMRYSYKLKQEWHTARLIPVFLVSSNYLINQTQCNFVKNLQNEPTIYTIFTSQDQMHLKDKGKGVKEARTCMKDLLMRNQLFQRFGSVFFHPESAQPSICHLRNRL